MGELGLVPPPKINPIHRINLCANTNPKIQEGKIHIYIKELKELERKTNSLMDLLFICESQNIGS